MKRIFMFFVAVFVLLLVFPLSMVGQRSEVEWIAAEQGYTSQQQVGGHAFSLTSDNSIQGEFSISNGSSGPIYYNGNDNPSFPNPNIRVYANNTLTITPATKVSISRVVYTFTLGRKKSDYKPASVIAPEGGTYIDGGIPQSWDETVEDIWTPNSPTEDPVTWKMGSVGQRGLVKIMVTYAIEGSTYVTLTYYANGGEGLMDSHSYIAGSSAMVEPCAFSNAGYVFEKWTANDNGDGTGVSYYPGDYITMTSDNNLYAHWMNLQDGFVSVLNATNVNEAMEEGSGWCDWSITQEVEPYTFIYKGKSYRNSNAIQINSNANIASGIVTTVSSGLASQVVVSWNSSTVTGHVLDVYARNYPYDLPADLFGTNPGTYLGSLVKGTSTTLEIQNANYAYIGVRSASGAVFMDEIRITWLVDSDQPFIRFTPETINLGNIVMDSTYSATFYVSQGNLGGNINLSTYLPNSLLNNTTIGMEANPTPVTWTYTPTEAGLMNDTIVATSTWEVEGRESVTVTKKLGITAVVTNPDAGDSLWVAKRNYIQNPQQDTIAVISLEGVEVVGKVGNDLYLQDNKAGLLVHGSGLPDLTTGDRFTAGSLMGTFTLYQNSIIELTEFTFFNESHTSNNALTPVPTSIDILLADNSHSYEYRYVQLDSVNIIFNGFSSWMVSSGNSELPLYDKFATGYTTMTPPEVEDKFTVKGLFNPYYAGGSLGIEVAPTTLGDFSTVKKATVTFDPVGGTSSNNPVEVTSVTITPAEHTTINYLVNGENMPASTSAVTINIYSHDVLTSIQAQATRDFYNPSNEFLYYYILPANTSTVAFSINGTIEDYVYVTGVLSASQCPAVDDIDPYLFLGWSTSASSTQVISEWPFMGIDDNMTLYAVYAVPAYFEYNKIASTSDITTGEYVILSDDRQGHYYTLKNEASSNSPTAYLIGDLGLSISGSKLYGNDLSEVTWTFTGTSTDMTVTSTANPANSLYVFDNSTGVRVGHAGTQACVWSVLEDNGLPGYFNMKDNAYDRYLTLYNRQDWRCYLRNNNNDFYLPPRYPRLTLFKKTPVFGDANEGYTRVFDNEDASGNIIVEGPSIIPSGKYLNMGTHSFQNTNDDSWFVVEDGATFTPAEGETNTINVTVNKAVAGYGTDMEAKTGWCLIGSPVGEVNVNDQTGSASVSGLYDGEETNYDLYIFDQSAMGEEWRNNKDPNNSEMVFGQWNGILYASQVDRTITYTGQLVTNCTEQTLAFSGNGAFKGWNLIGNPFTCPAYISLENYYKLEVVEQDGMMVSELQLKGHETPIEALEGVFVQANAENQTFSFVTSMPQGGNGEGLLNVRVTLTGRGSTVDQAMVRFGQGDELGKFMLHEHGTKLYIPQGNKDCAMVHVGNNGETPINFHVAKNGNYTITVMPEAVEMNYLHLIDNMTGADIDLLTNPSYSFEACTSDYESRFRLVYSMKEDNPSSDADTFAYYNGSAWVVSNMGEATLQVVDILGRIVSSKQINGNATISTADLDAGAYVMRLINGNDVKVQKVIIR